MLSSNIIDAVMVCIEIETRKGEEHLGITLEAQDNELVAVKNSQTSLYAKFYVLEMFLLE